MTFAGGPVASSTSHRRVGALPVAVLALGLAITGVAGSATRHQVSVLRRQRFEELVMAARTEIDREVTSYAETLYGLRRASRRTRTSRSIDRKSTRLNSSHSSTSYAVFCLKKKK